MSTSFRSAVVSIILTVFVCTPSIAQQEFFPFLAEVNENDVNVRAGQNRNFERLCQIHKGEEVVVVDKSFSWYKIQLPSSADIFISDKYLIKLKSDLGQVTGDNVNLRAGPGISFSVVGQADEGDRFKVVGFDQGWFKLAPGENTFGWVKEDFLTFKSNTIPKQEKVEVVIVKEAKKTQKAEKIQEETSALTPDPVLKKVPIALKGELQDLTPSKNEIYYKLISPSKPAYYIKGMGHLLDTFIGFQVKIEGHLIEADSSLKPLIRVSRVQLIL